MYRETSVADITMPTQDHEDCDMLHRVSEGSHAALEALYKEYYHRLFRFIYKITRQLDTIDEIINDVMLVVWRKADTFDHRSRVSTWIFGIAYKKSLKALEKSAVAIAHVDYEDIAETAADPSEYGIQQFEADDWVTVAFEVLSPDQRAVMELTYHYGLHYHEIAEIMECPENTVKTRMFHARKKLQPLLQTMKTQGKALNQSDGELR